MRPADALTVKRTCRQCGAPVDEISGEAVDVFNDMATGVAVVLSIAYELVPCGHGWIQDVRPPYTSTPLNPPPAAPVAAAPEGGRHRREAPPRRGWLRRRRAHVGA